MNTIEQGCVKNNVFFRFGYTEPKKHQYFLNPYTGTVFKMAKFIQLHYFLWGP